MKFYTLRAAEFLTAAGQYPGPVPGELPNAHEVLRGQRLLEDEVEELIEAYSVLTTTLFLDRADDSGRLKAWARFVGEVLDVLYTGFGLGARLGLDLSDYMDPRSDHINFAGYLFTKFDATGAWPGRFDKLNTQMVQLGRAWTTWSQFFLLSDTHFDLGGPLGTLMSEALRVLQVLALNPHHLFALIHRTNMEKVELGLVKDGTGKVLKPAGWRPADLSPILLSSWKGVV